MSDATKAPGGIERRRNSATMITKDDHFELARRVGDLQRRMTKLEGLGDRVAILEGLTQEVARANEAMRELINERQWFNKEVIDGIKKDLGFVVKWINNREASDLQKRYGTALLIASNVGVIVSLLLSWLGSR